MQKSTEQLDEITLVGIQVRTSYQREIDKMRGAIFPCVQHYFHQRLFDRIPDRKRPGTTFCAYTDYQSDHLGAYTYFIGEEVTSIPDLLLPGFALLKVPQQKYAKFTTGPAPMPHVVVNAWEAIWEMSSQELGGRRRFHTDFEIYDHRAADHENIVMDLFVGVEE